MFTPPDIGDHPLLDGQYLCFYRLECDDSHDREICTPELVRLTKGKLETIFTVAESAQEINIARVEEDFRACLQKLGILSIVSPFFTGSFFGFSRFIDMDERRLGAGKRDEVKNWIEYGGIDNEVYCDDWLSTLSETGVKVRGYNVEAKSFFNEE